VLVSIGCSVARSAAPRAFKARLISGLQDV
jgi:hypothetical protein